MDFLANLNYVEVFGVVTALVCVWLYTRQNVWSWPLTIVSAGLYMIVFFQAQLYADVGLQGVYIVVAVYGWYQWRFGGPQHNALPVSRLTRTTALSLLGIVVVGTGLLAYPLATYTNASLPFWDSLTTAMSLVAQWMLAKKILESWFVWIVADTLYVGIFLYKALYLTAGLYVVFLGLAVSGFIAWRASMRADSATVSA